MTNLTTSFFSLRALADVLPTRTTPFTWSIWGPAAERLLRDFYTELGASLPTQPLCTRSADGRLSVDVEALQQADQALQRTWGDASASLKGRFLGGADRRLTAMADRLLAETPERLAAVQRWQDRVQAMQWRQATVLQIMEEIEPKAEAALAGQSAVLAALALAGQLTAWLAEWLPGSAAALTRRLTAGLADGGVGAAYRHSLWQLEQTARREGLHAAAFAASRADFLQRYGRWAAEPLEAASPRWREAPEALDRYLAGRLALPADEEPPSPQRSAELRRQAAAEIEANLGLLRRRQFAAAFQRLQQLIDLALSAHEAEVAVIDTARYWAIGAAQEVVADGRLAAVEDVFLLEMEELKQVMTGEWSSPELVRGVVEQRREG